jgi:hypothetical protein
VSVRSPAIIPTVERQRVALTGLCGAKRKADTAIARKLCALRVSQAFSGAFSPITLLDGVTTMATNDVIANQETILANQEKILANQVRIEANQARLETLLANQTTIISNQETILANQVKLDAVLANQEKILANQEKILGK